MSLINDALKKAQRQRTGETAPQPSLPSAPTGGEHPEPRVVKRPKPAGFNAQMLKLGLVIGSAALILVVSVLIWSFAKPAPAPRVQAKTPPAPEPAAKATVVASSEKPTAAATAPVTTFSLNIPEPAPAKPEPVQPEPAKPEPVKKSPPVEKAVVQTEAPAKRVEAPAPVAETPVKAVEPVEKPAPVVAKPKPDPRVLAYIDTLRVTGIRAAGADSKVLMNDRVYRLNDVIEHQFGLKLVGVAVGALSFEDAQGATYTRNF